MSGVVVGKAGEIPPGGRKIVVPFRGRAGIGIFNIGGRFYALRNICPHRRGPLCTGEVAGRGAARQPPSASGGVMDYERDGQILRCPWHAWQFDIASGQCLADPGMRVKTFRVFVRGEDLVVDVQSSDLVN